MLAKQKIIEKFAKKFASTGKEAGVLAGVHYAADGTAFVTNRHYALRIKGAHDLSEATTIHTKTGMPINDKYPDIARVFPTHEAPHTIELPADMGGLLSSVRAAADVSKRLDSKVSYVKLTQANGSGLYNLRIDDQERSLTFTAHFGEVEGKDAPDVALNAEYLYTGLSVFDFARSDVKVGLYGRLSPIILSNGDDIDVLILPYKTAV